LVDGVPAFRRIAEAIASAQHSIWLTVAFYAHDFCFPDAAGEPLFDLLDRAAIRGLDVRVLFWRPNQHSSGYGHTFPGSQADFDLLRARGSWFSIRWDQAYAAFCQHQKSWIIDAGQANETAFIGGINLTATALGSPGHRDGGRHDLYVEITGPSATDVHHNFVQRWNEASERAKTDGVWGPVGAATLPFPARASSPLGESVVQIQRMVHPGRYTDSHPTPHGRCHDISVGERSILEQYEQAIEAARSSIYIENQALPVPVIARRLDAALRRGVEVVILVPAEPEAWVYRARRDPSQAELFDCVESLSCYETFALVGLVVSETGRSQPVYVHAKTMLVDDAWVTIGSCNLHANSLAGHTEMNATIWDAKVARALRCELLAEHLGQDTSALSDRAAMQLFRETAERNRVAMTNDSAGLQGLAVTLKAREYGR
jgi:phosphatidylserine/phosphatidylglycerophosphate/cardiolipin synthase-like enzyme